MSVNDLKKILVGKIAETNDEELLKVVYRLLDNAQEVHQLTPDEIHAVEEARAQYKKGEVLTNEEMMKEFEKWLKD
jgi:hypothetical protein